MVPFTFTLYNKIMGNPSIIIRNIYIGVTHSFYVMSRKQARTTRTSRRQFVKLAGAAGVAGLAGCGSQSGGTTTGGAGGGEPTEVTLWTLFAGGDGEAFKAIVNDFNEAHDDVQINRERQPFNSYYNKLFTSMTGNDAPDVAILHVDQLQRFADGIRPIGDRLSSGTEDQYIDAIWQEGAVGGDRIALPLDTHPNGLYYNKDIFEEAGLDPESPPESYEEFKTAADTITAETDKLAFSPEPYMLYWVRQYTALLNSLGSPLLSDDNSSAAFDNGAGKALAQYYADVTGDFGWDDADAAEHRGVKAFRSGDLAMTINGTWYFGVLQEQDFDWGMTKPWVAPGMEEKYTWANSHTIGLPRGKGKSDAQIDASVQVAEWITQNSLKWGTQAGHLPADKTVLESSTLRDATVWEKTLSTYQEMASDGQLAYTPKVENVGDYKRPINKKMAQVYAHQVDPVEGMSAAAEEVTSNLQG